MIDKENCVGIIDFPEQFVLVVYYSDLKLEGVVQSNRELLFPLMWHVWD